ncbi:MAG: type II toxin-antitoxin system VapC family toxin [Acidobacteriota bacterium]|nr:type II toxin-antitoxin system VapC family toxin [Acidobacteriota bacterium]
MAILFLDTSAAVKRYIRETGTSWLINQIRPATTDAFVANVTGIETISAIVRRRRGGSLTAADADKALRRFRRDFASRYIDVELTALVIQLAMQLAEKHNLRGYDAAQLAVAVSINHRLLAKGVSGLTFVCADAELLNSAQAEGLLVENPNLHP